MIRGDGMKTFLAQANHSGPRLSPGSDACCGFSAVEILIAISILAIGLMAQASLALSHSNQTRLNREFRAALEGARAKIEVLKEHDFKTVFAAFDASTRNDPPDAPGPGFALHGLSPVHRDPDGLVGKVRFPVGSPPANWTHQDPVLREDLDDDLFGLPRELDGDGAVDSHPKDERYIHLPVVVEVRWRGVSGNQILRLTTWLTPREDSQ